MAISTVEADARPLILNGITNQPIHKLDKIMDILTIDDYRSIFFLLIDVKMDKEEFLSLVKKDEETLKRRFRNIYYSFRSRDALLIEIFGTMQKYNLLKLLGTCCHVFKKDKDTFTQLTSLWKFLFSVCEQLEDGEVEYLKEKLFPERENLNIFCAEELICLAFFEGKLDENTWQNTLAKISIFSLNTDIGKLVTSYKSSHLNYYPIRRPTKTAPCGIAVIMNHVKFDKTYSERPESNSDANALKNLWESFGFKTEMHTDLTASEVLQVFKKLSNENHTNYDAFVVCYLSHGNAGIVIAKDGKAIRFDDLVDLIANHCESLVGKPKLFFVQACQGRGIQTGFGGPTLNIQSETEVQPTRLSKNVARGTDVLVFNSSIEGFASFRDGKSSWFIDALVSNMAKYGDDLNVASILTKVVNTVSEKEGTVTGKEGTHIKSITNCKQTPVGYNTLKYELKLKKVLAL